MTCGRCGKQIVGWIEDHECKGERVEKIKRYLVYNDGIEMEFREASKHEMQVRKTWCIPSDVAQLEKENEELRNRLSEATELIEYVLGQTDDPRIYATLLKFTCKEQP